jgi:hypothetical protein
VEDSSDFGFLYSLVNRKALVAIILKVKVNVTEVSI